VGYTFDERMTVLGPHVHDGVPLVQAASAAGVPLRTAELWLTAYLTRVRPGCIEPGERTRAGSGCRMSCSK
jgi:putative transposase